MLRADKSKADDSQAGEGSRASDTPQGMLQRVRDVLQIRRDGDGAGALGLAGGGGLFSWPLRERSVPLPVTSSPGQFL